MNPRVVDVKPLPDHRLSLEFTNGERRVFDCSPYLGLGVFQRLHEPAFFRLVRAHGGTVEWPNDVDICPDTLYIGSVPLQMDHEA